MCADAVVDVRLEWAVETHFARRGEDYGIAGCSDLKDMRVNI